MSIHSTHKAGQRFSRRDFLKVSSAAGLGALLAACGGRKEKVDLAMTTPSEVDVDVVVVGGGVAGLTAAYLLRDYRVKVLEKEDRVGGKAVSGDYQGFIYAKGAEYLELPEGTLSRLLNELRMKPKEIPSPADAYYYDGKFYFGVDGAALKFIRYSSLAEYNNFVSIIQKYFGAYANVPGLDMKSDLAQLDDISAGVWFQNQGFPQILQGAYNVTARGLFGANLNEISALSYLPELGFDFKSARPVSSVSELTHRIEKGTEKTGVYTFVTGITEITNGLAAVLGERIQVGAEVISVVRRQDYYLVRYKAKNGQELSLSSRLVILAVPAPIALSIAPMVLQEEQKKLLEQIPYAPYLTVALFSEQPVFDKAFDLVAPEGWFFTDIYDSTWVQRYYDRTLEYHPASVMTVYVAPQSYQDRGLLQLSDEDVLAQVYRDLEKLFPGAQEAIVGYDIQRFPYAFPVMTVGAYKRLTRLHKITKGDLLLAGDYMIYPTFEAAVESGAQAAEKALERLK